MRHFEKRAQPSEEVTFSIPPHVKTRKGVVMHWDDELGLYAILSGGQLYRVTPELVRPKR